VSRCHWGAFDLRFRRKPQAFAADAVASRGAAELWCSGEDTTATQTKSSLAAVFIGKTRVSQHLLCCAELLRFEGSPPTCCGPRGELI
jgi:hypothetical protein